MTMHALTLWRPWGNAILRHGKDVENRGWHPPRWIIGKTIAIHNAKRIDNRGVAEVMTILRGDKPAYGIDADLLCGPPSCIVGVVLVTGSATHSDSPWFSGPICWRLSSPLALPRPIPIPGKQGLWSLPPAVEADLREQLDLVDA